MSGNHVLLTAIKVVFFVRARLDEDRVLFFMRLYEAGHTVEPIIVNKKTNELLDGRHRIEALKRLGRKHVEVMWKTVKNREEAVIFAFSANVGGPKPPTLADFNHTISLLLQDGVPASRIIENLSKSTGAPLKLYRRYVKDVQSQIAKACLSKAALAIADEDLTVNQAAKKFDVDETQLRNKLRGTKKKTDSLGLDALKGGISKRFQSFAAANGRFLGSLAESHRDGDIGNEAVREALLHFGKRLNDQNHTYREWLKRFTAGGVAVGIKVDK